MYCCNGIVSSEIPAYRIPSNRPHVTHGISTAATRGTGPHSASRRDFLFSVSLISSTLHGEGQKSDVRAQELDTNSPSTSRGAGPEEFEVPNYGEQGPLKAVKLPRLEHTCTTCNTSADRCRIRISAWVPQQGSQAIQVQRPFPLAIITPGFLISADQYTSYAERLASWGYAVVAYDSVQQALDPSTDLACVDLLEELILWCKTSKPMGMVCDTDNVMLIGHSRGAKISTLAAVRDERVKSLCLIDPVDVTVYTPLSNDFPSATDALSHDRRNIPVCIIGGGNGGDCAPSESSFDLYYRSARGPAWQTIVEDAGHLQFIDNRSATAMGLVCQAGRSIADSQVEDVTRSIMVAWAESVMARQRIVKSPSSGSLVAMSDSRMLLDHDFIGMVEKQITENAGNLKTKFQFKNII